MAEKLADSSKATPRRYRNTIPKNEAKPTQSMVEPKVEPKVEPMSEPVVVAPEITLQEQPEEPSPKPFTPVMVTLIEGASYRDKVTKSLFLKGRPLLITDRALAERCSCCSRFKIGDAR